MTIRKRTSSLKALGLIDSIVLRIGKDRKEYVFSIKKEMRIIREGLQRMDFRHHERYAFWRRMRAEASRAKRKAESDYQSIRDAMFLSVGDKLRERSQRDTNEHAQAHTRLQEPVMRAKARLDRAIYQEDLCDMMCAAFVQRQTVLMKIRVERKP